MAVSCWWTVVEVGEVVAVRLGLAMSSELLVMSVEPFEMVVLLVVVLLSML